MKHKGKQFEIEKEGAYINKTKRSLSIKATRMSDLEEPSVRSFHIP